MLTDKRLIKVNKWAKTILEISCSLLFALLFLWLLLHLIVPDNALFGEGTIGQQVFRYSALSLLVPFLCGVIVRCALAPFVKGEEETEVPIKKKPIAVEAATPLCNVNEVQSEAICTLLRKIPSHSSKPDHINLAQVSQFLTALMQMGLLDDTDRIRLRLWVEQQTGRIVPPVSQFNEGYPSGTVSKVNKEKKRIEDALSRYARK